MSERQGPPIDSVLGPTATVRDDGRVAQRITVGVSGEKRFIVTTDMAPPWLQTKVLSTGSLVQLIEHTCIETAQAHLGDTEGTVGTHINVSRTGAPFAGDEVIVRCHIETVSGPRLTFRVSVEGPSGTISKGIHQRQIVDLTRFPIR